MTLLFGTVPLQVDDGSLKVPSHTGHAVSGNVACEIPLFDKLQFNSVTVTLWGNMTLTGILPKINGIHDSEGINDY